MDIVAPCIKYKENQLLIFDRKMRHELISLTWSRYLLLCSSKISVIHAIKAVFKMTFLTFFDNGKCPVTCSDGILQQMQWKNSFQMRATVGSDWIGGKMEFEWTGNRILLNFIKGLTMCLLTINNSLHSNHWIVSKYWQFFVHPNNNKKII